MNKPAPVVRSPFSLNGGLLIIQNYAPVDLVNDSEHKSLLFSLIFWTYPSSKRDTNNQSPARILSRKLRK